MAITFAFTPDWDDTIVFPIYISEALTGISSLGIVTSTISAMVVFGTSRVKTGAISEVSSVLRVPPVPYHFSGGTIIFLDSQVFIPSIPDSNHSITCPPPMIKEKELFVSCTFPSTLSVYESVTYFHD